MHVNANYNSLLGPVERRGNDLVLRIPMEAGGDKLQSVTRTISYVENGNLVVVIPDWLAQKMQLDESSEVYLDDRWGKLNMARVH